MAACQAGDTLVVTKLERLVRSLPDARDTADELIAIGATLFLGGSDCDLTDPVGRLQFHALSIMAEFTGSCKEGQNFRYRMFLFSDLVQCVLSGSGSVRPRPRPRTFETSGTSEEPL